MPENVAKPLKNKQVYVLGAGPAGLATAYVLTKQGYSTAVVERDSRVGGLAKSIKYRDFILDLGPHRFFTRIVPVLKLWNEVLGENQVVVNRLTRIYYDGKYFSYPLKAFEAVSALGLIESSKIMASYGKSRLTFRREPRNFAEWITSKFGKRLFEIFFEGYTEKLWGIPCTEISADWAAQRIKGLSLSKAALNALFGNKGKVKTLIDQFQYPRMGSGQLYESIKDYLHQNNQTVMLDTEVVRVHHQDQQVRQITLRNRQTNEAETVDCNELISSIPISLLIQQLDPSPPAEVIEASKSLKFRNTILVYLIVGASELFPDNWLYINDPNVQLGRVTNFANWSQEMLPNDEQTPLCCEYWCNTNEAMWRKSDEELLAQAEKDLKRINLLDDEKITGGFVLRLPRTYPIYAGDYKESLATIQDYLEKFSNLQLVGRYGAFKYNNQDHSLLMGIMAAENIESPGRHNLWDVNSDDEYQE